MLPWWEAFFQIGCVWVQTGWEKTQFGAWNANIYLLVLYCFGLVFMLFKVILFDWKPPLQSGNPVSEHHVLLRRLSNCCELDIKPHFQLKILYRHKTIVFWPKSKSDSKAIIIIMNTRLTASSPLPSCDFLLVLFLISGIWQTPNEVLFYARTEWLFCVSLERHWRGCIHTKHNIENKHTRTTASRTMLA